MSDLERAANIRRFRASLRRRTRGYVLEERAFPSTVLRRRDAFSDCRIDPRRMVARLATFPGKRADRAGAS